MVALDQMENGGLRPEAVAAELGVARRVAS